MTNPVHVGVIGLGRLWHKRYRPALAGLRDRFRVAAVCDQVQQLAAREARHLSCHPAAGPTDLLENPDVEAVLLLDPQWYRLWPLELAGRLGKPVFCCSLLDADAGHADDLYRRAREGRLPVLWEMPARVAPATRRLRELLDGPLGPPRVLVGEAGEEGSAAGVAGTAVLLDLCADLLGGAPAGVLAGGADGPAEALVFPYADGRLVNLTRCSAPWAGNRLRLHVLAERGRAAVEFFHRVHWTDATGQHTETLPVDRPLGHLLLDQFYRVVREDEAPRPGLDEAHRLLGWLRAAARSRAEGRRVELEEVRDQ